MKYLPCVGTLVIVLTACSLSARAGEVVEQKPLTLVVMDPLAAPLAGEAVPAEARRKYELLGNALSQKLQRPVSVYWSASLVQTLEEKSKGSADLIIGPHSVVVGESRRAERSFVPVASLTGLEGSTLQTGLIVVRSENPAHTVSDLAGYRIFFGPDVCEEKSQAALDLLGQSDVPAPLPRETCATCLKATKKLLDLEADVKAAAVISSSSAALLTGHGPVPPGALRVIGVTDPVPFITAFLNADLPASDQTAIRQVLLTVQNDPPLKSALQTAGGFIAYPPPNSPRPQREVSQVVDPSAGERSTGRN